MPKIPFWVFILLALLYFSAVRVDTMDVDASQYAEMSREMLKSGDHLHLYDRGKEYLDKPPFLFWASSASMAVFGVNNFGYKLPSILFALWALFALYRLTRLLYDEETARMAALILGVCQGMFLMTNDVRCDTILMSWVITAIWLIKEWNIKGRLYYLLLGFAAVAFGMMTKGPIALLVPVFTLASDWALKRQWKNFFRPAYLLGILVIGILLIPMSIGLYQQFDLHPEKVMDGVKGVSGLRFFYWTQSFGRITGESKWSNGADFSFLALNMLWSFLPWIFLFLAAIVLNIKKLVKQKFRLQPHQEWLSTGGFLLTYISLGISKYQLPHYIFVVFPHAAIITAKLFRDFSAGKYPKLYKFMRPFQFIMIGLLFVGCSLLLTIVFPANVIVIILFVLALLFWLYIGFKKNIRGKIFWVSAAGIMLINAFLTNQFYYRLLTYQVGSHAGRYIKEHRIPTDQVITYKVEDPLNSLFFYANGTIASTDTIMGVQGKNYVLTMNKGLKKLAAAGYKYDITMTGQAFKVSELTLPFLNPKTRNSELKNYYLVKLK